MKERFDRRNVIDPNQPTTHEERLEMCRRLQSGLEPVPFDAVAAIRQGRDDAARRVQRTVQEAS